MTHHEMFLVFFGQTISEWNFAPQLIKKNKFLLTSECQLAFENLSKSQINLNENIS